MAANVTNPLALTVPAGGVVETVTKASATPSTAFLAYTRAGTLPASNGAYAAGVCTQSTDASESALPLQTIGYAIIRVQPGAVIAVDAPVAVATTGEAIPLPGTGTPYTLGRALNSSNGAGTSQAPHFIVVKLA